MFVVGELLPINRERTDGDGADRGPMTVPPEQYAGGERTPDLQRRNPPFAPASVSLPRLYAYLTVCAERVVPVGATGNCRYLDFEPPLIRIFQRFFANIADPLWPVVGCE